MLDGNAYRAHFPDDPAYQPPSSMRPSPVPNSAALLAALAALENEFRTILAQNATSNE